VKKLSQSFLILGGARSGKSSFAEKIAENLGETEVVYLATAQALDQEMEDRIKHHQNQRPKDWKTVEEPIEVNKVLESIEKGKTVLMDCLTLYISNMILKTEELNDDENNLEQKVNIEKEIIEEIKKIITTAQARDLNLIIVSNEVGQGVVPNNELGRLFRDIAGRANQFTADKVDKVFLTVAGFPLDIKDISLKNKSDFLENLKED